MNIIELIKTEDKFTVGALIALYDCQTPEEQNVKYTAVDNTKGFNKIDAFVMSDIAKKYLQSGILTERQINFVRKTILKYHRQIEQLNVKPMKINERKKKELGKDIKWAGLKGGKIEIKFQMKDREAFFETLARVKGIMSRSFDNPTKTWTAPLAVDTVEDLIAWGFQLGTGLQGWYEKLSKPPDIKEIQIEGLKMELYPFQKHGVAFIDSRGGKALIADEMGTGKTMQALAWLQFKQAFPAIIIVPATVKLNWEREIQRWLPTNLKTTVLSGKQAEEDLFSKTKKDIYIINYDIVMARKEELLKLKPKAIILDEVHYIKNQKAQRTKAVRSLTKTSDYLIGLSGTPIINRPVEFFTILNLLMPDRYKSFWQYAHRFCKPRHTGFGWDFTGASNTEKLHKELISTVMIRRLKSEVLKELPPKTRCVLPLEITNRKEYNKANNDFLSWVKENYGEEKAKKAGSAEALAQVEALKQLSAKGKMKAAIEWIENYIDSNGKLVVYATHHKVIDKLMEHFKNRCVKLDGRDSQVQKQKAVDTFQDNPNILLFIGNIKAAGIGITLTAASDTCFIEVGWTPGEHNQAEDRVHRIGQEAQSVTAYYLIGVNTIDEDIINLLDKKAKVIDQILDGKSVKEESVFTELINILQSKEKP